MADDESFAGAPLAIDEVRAMRSNKASDITPRSTLIEVLRAIDVGVLAPDALVIVYTPNQAGAHEVGYRVSSPNSILTLGMLARAIHDLQT